MKAHQAALPSTASHHEITWGGYNCIWRNGTISSAHLCVSAPQRRHTALCVWDRSDEAPRGLRRKGIHAARDSLEKISQPSGTKCEKAHAGFRMENEVLRLSCYTMLSMQREEFTFLGLLAKWAPSKTEGQLSSKLALQRFTFKRGLAPIPLTEVKTFHAFQFDWPSYYSPYLKERDSWR